eukprot:scaffold2045_cov404-Prasinococcus_capsulatus_cf.AAC.45
MRRGHTCRCSSGLQAHDLPCRRRRTDQAPPIRCKWEVKRELKAAVRTPRLVDAASRARLRTRTQQADCVAQTKEEIQE